MLSLNSFHICSSESSSILSHIALNAANLSNDGGQPLDAYFGTGFSKLERHDVWYLPSTATKSLMLSHLEWFWNNKKIRSE